MKIYTRTGDDGTTGLIGGGRVNKGDLRIECYGTVDELNAVIGWAAVVCDDEMRLMLEPIQNELFVIGSHLATPDEPAANQTANLPKLDDAMIGCLESQIDAAEAQLAALRQFILPGGSEAAARLHIARTVCRRAERKLVKLTQDRPVAPVMITYLNRLSDWLFVQARQANQKAGVADVPWKK